ncbi:MAG: hypothetical protein HY457_02655 [Parcubacteria group bacterium]|nr:hypothetical protein [Parcubacteria group bacterium]
MANFERPMSTGGAEGAPEAPRQATRAEKAKLTRQINILERQLEKLAHEDREQPGAQAERERIGAERNRLWDLRNQMDTEVASSEAVFPNVPMGEGTFDEAESAPQEMRVAGETYEDTPPPTPETLRPDTQEKAEEPKAHFSYKWTGRRTGEPGEAEEIAREEAEREEKLRALGKKTPQKNKGDIPVRQEPSEPVVWDSSKTTGRRTKGEEAIDSRVTAFKKKIRGIADGTIPVPLAGETPARETLTAEEEPTPLYDAAVREGYIKEELKPRRRRQALVTPKADAEFPGEVSEAERRHLEELGRMTPWTGEESPEVGREMTPEEQGRRLEEWLGEMQNSIRAEAERKSLWQYMRGASERYAKLPFYQKIAVGLALTAGVGSGALLGGPAGLAITAGAMGAKLGVGFLTFLGTYEAVESLAERSRERQVKFWNKYPRVLGAVAGAITGGISAYSIGQALEWVADNFASSATEGAARVAVEAADRGGQVVAEVRPGLVEPKVVTPEMPPASDYAEGSGVYAVGGEVGSQESVVQIGAEAARTITAEVAKGDTVWGLLKNGLGEKLAGLSPEQQTYVIDGLKDKLAAMTPAELKDLGIKSGNIDRIFPGQKLDFTSLLGDSSLVEKLKAGAENLTAEQLQNIREGGVALPPTPLAEAMEAPTVEQAAEVLEKGAEVVVNEEAGSVEHMGTEVFFDKSAANIYEQGNGELIAWGGTDDAKAALAERIAGETGKQVRVDASMGSYYVTPEGSRVSIEETFKSFGDWWSRLWGNMPEPEGVATMLTRNK